MATSHFHPLANEGLPSEPFRPIISESVVMEAVVRIHGYDLLDKTPLAFAFGGGPEGLREYVFSRNELSFDGLNREGWDPRIGRDLVVMLDPVVISWRQPIDDLLDIFLQSHSVSESTEVGRILTHFVQVSGHAAAFQKRQRVDLATSELDDEVIRRLELQFQLAKGFSGI